MGLEREPCSEAVLEEKSKLDGGIGREGVNRMLK